MDFEERFVKSYNADEIVFLQGSAAAHMYVVLEGGVDIRREAKGDETTIASLGPGDIFGEMAIVDSGVRMASAVANTPDTRLLEIDQARFIYLTSQQPVFALTVMRVMAQRMLAQGQ